MKVRKIILRIALLWGRAVWGWALSFHQRVIGASKEDSAVDSCDGSGNFFFLPGVSKLAPNSIPILVTTWPCWGWVNIDYSKVVCNTLIYQHTIAYLSGQSAFSVSPVQGQSRNWGKIKMRGASTGKYLPETAPCICNRARYRCSHRAQRKRWLRVLGKFLVLARVYALSLPIFKRPCFTNWTHSWLIKYKLSKIVL